jgi:Uma2 family endonuclease
MVAAVLTLLWQDVAGVTELTRMLARSGFLWCRPTTVTQQAMSQRFLSFPATLFEGVFKNLLPSLRTAWHQRNQRPLPESIQFALRKFSRIWIIEICSLGSTTWSREDLKRGLEPDECYYIQNELAIRGKDEIDLTIDPPPDLAIEVDSTSSSMNRMGIYAALRVPEVWRFDRETLTILSLVNDDYQPCQVSLVLPMFNSAVLISFLELSQTMGETSLIRHVRQWVREQMESNGIR